MAAADNTRGKVPAENCFNTLRREEVYLEEHWTFAETQANFTQFINDVHNTGWLHSRADYLPPAEFGTARPVTGAG